LRLFVLVLLSLGACAGQETPSPEAAETALGADALQVLIVGGHESHDFDRWFNEEDRATLASAGIQATYTDVPDNLQPFLDDIDLLILSNNQPLPDSSLREALFDFVDSGKGLLVLHASNWYSWADWPAFNRDLVGGGSRSHGAYGPFEVTVAQADHPIMEGVPATFTLDDELYRFQPDSTGARMNVLAIGTEPDSGVEFPVVWTIEHPTRRIVCITLGHDAAAHESEPYQSLLLNSVAWLTR
jgi:type 1 glutamine amidotransferase